MSIDSCPKCHASLRARRETWFGEIVLSEEGNLLSATQRPDMEDVWRVYCASGHEFALPEALNRASCGTPPSRSRDRKSYRTTGTLVLLTSFSG